MAATDVGELVEAAAAGDEQAWNGLVQRFAGLIWSIALAHNLGPAEAGDVSQTCWLRLVENLDRINEPDRIGAWLATTARRECLAVLRRAGRQVPTDSDDDLEPQPVEAPIEAGVLTAERDRALWAAVDDLPPRCRALLRLLMTDPEPSYEEVGAALDMPIGSIGPTRGRCLEKLRRKLVLAGITGITRDSGDST